MTTHKSVFMYSDDFERFAYPPDAPFKTERVRMTRDTIQSMGLLGAADRAEHTPVPATRAELEAFHDPAYLNMLNHVEQGHLDVEALRHGLGTPDCPVFRGLYDYSALACGASMQGARLLLAGEADAVFNTAGGLHHAGPNYAAGFCYMNDVVLAAQTLADAGKRVFCLDLDAHHGDGVQNAFFDRRDVFTLSMHESGRSLFPGTGFENEIGSGPGRGFCVNIPLPVGTYDGAFEKAFTAIALPLLRVFDPDVIVMEVGLDGLAGDPLAHLHLTNNVYADIVRRIQALNKPMLATGGGGYNVPNTVRGWALIWSVLAHAHTAHDDLALGMGGVMLENTEWAGGLRDRVLLSESGDRGAIDHDIARTIETLEKTVFPIHGL